MTGIHLLSIGMFFYSALNSHASLAPGDIFREYKWRPEGKWQRVTGPDAKTDGAKAFLPNDVNTIVIDDLDQATRIEAVVEMLLCHGGTINKRMRINGGAWIPIPESPLIPGDAGTGGPDQEYQYMRYPGVELPLGLFHEGENTFEFTCSCGTALGSNWPQWILYGTTFRVYYDGSKPHPTGAIISPSTNSTIAESPAFEVEAVSPDGVKQVDLIGCYEDFNWEGDGSYRQWHYRYFFGEIKSHIGTTTKKPYRVEWDNAWIPTQDQPMEVVARITDSTGMSYVTPAVQNINLYRPHTVRMYKPYDIPRRWSSRAGKKHQCKVDVSDDLSKARAAKIIMVTWNGVAANEIGINDKKVVAKVGKNHDLSYDEFPVPLGLIKPGVNTLYTFSKTEHHGIEVQWPGMVLLIQYDKPEGNEE